MVNISLKLLIGIITYIIAYKNISSYKFSLKEYIYIILSVEIVGCLLFLVNTKLFSIPSYTIPIIFIYIKNRDILKSMILHIFICFIIIFNSNLSGLLSIKVLNIISPYTYKYNFAVLIVLINLYCLTKVIRLLYQKYKGVLNNIYKSKTVIIMMIVFAIILGLVYLNIDWNYIDNQIKFIQNNGLLFVMYSLILMIICILIAFLIHKGMKFKSEQEQFKNLQEYTNNLEELYMDMRKFRHDYINILSSISAYLNKKDIEGLEDYFYKYIYPLDKTMEDKDFKLGFLKNIKMMEIKGLLSAKLIRAQELNLNVTIDIAEKVSSISMNIIDLVRVVGILLDNAIEAAIKSENKVVKVGVINKESSVIIVIINSYSGNIPPIYQMFKEGFSTKGDNRGIGLSNMKSIINKYRNITLDTSTEEKSFIQCLTINNKM